jgi:hypothetical protein
VSANPVISIKLRIFPISKYRNTKNEVVTVAAKTPLLAFPRSMEKVSMNAVKTVEKKIGTARNE